MLGLNMVRFWTVPAAARGRARRLHGRFAYRDQLWQGSRAAAACARPYPEKYRMQVADFMRTYLDNPTKVKDAFIGEPVVKPVGGTPLYVTCVRYNPRDSKNQYEGGKTNLAVFLGGKLSQFLPGDPELCNGLAYTRYPEIESMVP